MRRAILLILLACGGWLLNGQSDPFAGYPQRAERERTYDIRHYCLRLILDDVKKRVCGENEITLTSLGDGLRVCRLDVEDFTVNAVHDGTGAALVFKQTPGELHIDLPRACGYGEKLKLVVAYTLEKPQKGLQFIEGNVDHPAQVDTYSWPEDARRWFPCYDYPNQKATCEYFITVRRDWQALANGKLIDVAEDRQKQTRTYHWLESVPLATCVMMIAAGPYEVVEDRSGPVPVHYWVYGRGRPDDARRIFGEAPRIIEFFSSIFGFAFPWEKYDQVCVAGSGGGLEAASATLLGDGVLEDAAADAAADFPSVGLIAHELAHQWWGDTVTERDWSHVWLSESFATYSEYLYLRHRLGDDEGALNLLEKKNSYLAEAHQKYLRPIVCDRYLNPWNIMDAHAYPKGALVLHMLRDLLGEQAFFRSLQHFLQKHAFAVADSHDLQTAVKEATGQNMDWFFWQWLFLPGHPRLEIESHWQPAEKQLRLTIRQVQDRGHGVPVYRLPAAVKIVLSQGVRREKIWISRLEEDFVFAAEQEPLLVRFDPDNVLLSEVVFPRSRAELLYQLQHDDAIGRMMAAGELGRLPGDEAAAEALRGSAYADSFWAVRRAAIEALAQRRNAGDESLWRRLCEDGSSRVRAAAIAALGACRRPGLARFFHRIYGRDASFLVQAEALKALGACSGAASLPFLAKAATRRSPHRILQRAVEAARRLISGSADRDPY